MYVTEELKMNGAEKNMLYSKKEVIEMLMKIDCP